MGPRDSALGMARYTERPAQQWTLLEISMDYQSKTQSQNGFLSSR